MSTTLCTRDNAERTSSSSDSSGSSSAVVSNSFKIDKALTVSNKRPP